MKVDLGGSGAKKSRRCWYEGVRGKIRLRSLAEREIAVMLDGLGVKWWYEPHVVIVGRNTWYRPDFLVELDDGQIIWIEVKGPAPTKSERLKARGLAEVTKRDVYLVWDGGSEALLFRAGGGSGERVGGLRATGRFER